MQGPVRLSGCARGHAWTVGATIEQVVKKHLSFNRPTVDYLSIDGSGDQLCEGMEDEVDEAPASEAQLEPEPAKRSWYRLFKHMDDDGTGLITFDEFEDMVRNELHIKARRAARGEIALSEANLKSVWRALDADGSGYIAAGEFGIRRPSNHLRPATPSRPKRHRL